MTSFMTEETTMNASFKPRLPRHLATILLVSCVLGAPAAMADEPVRAETVRFSDLNVETPEGIKALYGRIHQAAKKVCDEHDTDPFRGAIEQACFQKSEQAAVKRLNVPKLTAFYNDRVQRKAVSPQLVAAR